MLAAEVEQGLELVGATAIEDKLQARDLRLPACCSIPRVAWLTPLCRVPRRRMVCRQQFGACWMLAFACG